MFKEPFDFASSNRGVLHHLLGIAPSLSDREISARKTRLVNFRPWSTIDVNQIIHDLKAVAAHHFLSTNPAARFKMKVSTDELLCVKIAVVVKILRVCFTTSWMEGSKNTDLKYQLVLTQRQDFEINHFEGKKSLMTTLQVKPCEPQNETGCTEQVPKTLLAFARENTDFEKTEKYFTLCRFFFPCFKLELLCYFTLKLCDLLKTSVYCNHFDIQDHRPALKDSVGFEECEPLFLDSVVICLLFGY